MPPGVNQLCCPNCESLAKEVSALEHDKEGLELSLKSLTEHHEAQTSELAEERDALAKRLAETEELLTETLEGLSAPTHADNDYNCQDWPPGYGCDGCRGDDIRREIYIKVQAFLSRRLSGYLAVNREDVKRLANLLISGRLKCSCGFTPGPAQKEPCACGWTPIEELFSDMFNIDLQQLDRDRHAKKGEKRC
jgi:hypothetical protein